MVEWGRSPANAQHAPLLPGFPPGSCEPRVPFLRGSAAQQQSWDPQLVVPSRRPVRLASSPHFNAPDGGAGRNAKDPASFASHGTLPHRHLHLLRSDCHEKGDDRRPFSERGAKPKEGTTQSAPTGDEPVCPKASPPSPAKRRIVLNARCARLEKPLVEQCARELDWTLSESPEEPADVSWFGTAIAEPQYRHVLASTHTVNRLPSLQEIVRKRWLSRILNILKIVDPQRMHFVPETYLLPEDAETVRHCLARADQGAPLFVTPSAYATYPKTAAPKDGKTVFILKPDAGAQGSGLKLINRFEDIPANVLSGVGGYICQRYIDNPLKLNKRKFDIRVYVFITRIVPEFEAFIGSEALTRFCTVDYVPADRSNFKNTFMHFTNYSINKENTHHYLRSADLRSPLNSKRPLEDVLKDLSALGYNPKQIWQQILKIVAETLHGLKPFVSLAYKCVMAESQLWKTGTADLCNRCFQILGFDILLDETGKAWLLEVNSNPSLRTSFETPQAKKLDMLMASQYITPAAHLEACHWRRKKDAVLSDVAHPLVSSLSTPVGEGSVDYMIKKPLVLEALKVVQYYVGLEKRHVASQEAAESSAMDPGLSPNVGRKSGSADGAGNLVNGDTRWKDHAGDREHFSPVPGAQDPHRPGHLDGPSEPVYNQARTQLSKGHYQGDVASDKTNLSWLSGAPDVTCGPRRKWHGKKVVSPGYSDAKAEVLSEARSAWDSVVIRRFGQTPLQRDAANRARFFAKLQHWMPIIVPEKDHTALVLGLRDNPQTVRAQSHPVASCWAFTETVVKPEKQLVGGAQYPVGAGLLTCCQYLYEQATRFPECLTLRLSHWEVFAAMSGLRTIVSHVQVPCFFSTKLSYPPGTLIPLDDSNSRLSIRLSSALAGTTRTVKAKRKPGTPPSENISNFRNSQTYGPLFHVEDERPHNVLTRIPAGVTSLEKRAAATGLGVRELPSRCVATRPLSWADLRWLFCRPRRRDGKCRNPSGVSSCYGCDTLRERHPTVPHCSSNHPERYADLGFWGFWELLLQIASLIHTAEAAGKRDKDPHAAAVAQLNRGEGASGKLNHNSGSPSSTWKPQVTPEVLPKGKHTAMYAHTENGSSESQRLQRCATKLLQWWPDSQKIVKKVLELDPEGIGSTLHRLIYALVANVQAADLSRKPPSGNGPTDTTKRPTECRSAVPFAKEPRFHKFQDNDDTVDFTGVVSSSDSTRPGDE